MSLYRNKYINGYIKKRELVTPDFSTHIKRHYFIRFLTCMVLYLLPRERRYLFDCERKNSEKTNIAIYKPAEKLVDVNDGLFKIKTVGSPSFRGDYFSLHKLFFYLYLYLFVSKGFVRLYRREVLKLRDTFRKTNYLILNSDGLPLSRAVLSATYGLKTKSICLQHGTFSNSLPGQIDGSMCDINVIQNRSQEKFFKQSGAKVDMIYSELPDVYESQKVKRSPSRKFVVLIGQGLISEDKLKHQQQLIEYKKVIKLLRENSVKVRYRPHPIEYKNPVELFKILFVLRCMPTKIIDRDYTFVGHRSTLLNRLYFNNYEVYTISNSPIGALPTFAINDFLFNECNENNYEIEEWTQIFYDHYVPFKYCWRKIYDQIQK